MAHQVKALDTTSGDQNLIVETCAHAYTTHTYRINI